MAHHTVGNWESSHLDHATQWFLLSRAYLDGSTRLCSAMVAGDFPLTFEHGKVAMGLCVHSVELFYKAVIWKATGAAPATHNLTQLERRVRTIAPDVASLFSCPFRVEPVQAASDPERAAEIAEARRREEKTLDQQMRYHVDEDGNLWPGLQGFMPELFLATLQSCAQQYRMVIGTLCPELQPGGR